MVKLTQCTGGYFINYFFEYIFRFHTSPRRIVAYSQAKNICYPFFMDLVKGIEQFLDLHLCFQDYQGSLTAHLHGYPGNIWVGEKQH